MMIHAAIHWPEVSDASLWPMTVQHAAYLYNRVPDPSTGLAPVDIFTRQCWPQSWSHDLQVWGCPIYVLDKTLADGNKIGKWKPRSIRHILMGVSPRHASTIPSLLNPETGSINTAYHVVFDDWFATVPTSENDRPDFTSDTWHKLFGDSRFQYVFDEDDLDEPTQADPFHPVDPLVHERRAAVEAAMDTSQPAVPLPVPPPPVIVGLSPQAPPITPVPIRAPPVTVDDAVAPQASPVQREQPLPRESPAQVDPPTQRESVTQPSQPQSEPYQASPSRRQREKNVSNEQVSSNENAPLRRSTRHRNPVDRLNLLAESKHNLFAPFFETSTAYLADALTASLPPLYHASLVSPVFSSNAFKAVVKDPDLFSYDEAMGDPDNVDEWREAGLKEICTLEEKGAWELDDVSNATSKIIPTTWVFKVKRTPDGEILKHKARICVRGDLQETTGDNFAPVVAWSTVRLFLVVASILNWKTCAIDFESAFIQASLPYPVWIHLPRGFGTNAPSGRRLCLRLKKTVYGQKESPKLWYEHLYKALKSEGFHQCLHDPCLLLKKNMLMVTFVDDCGIAYLHEKDVETLITNLRNRGFTLTREGDFTSFLGIKFERDEKAGTLTMTQRGLIDRGTECR